jgi:hypothetical protein
MPIISLRYEFRQPFRVSANQAYDWCTDFGPDDGRLFAERTLRSVRRWAEDTLVMTDTTYPAGRARRIRRLVRLVPSESAWTNTHLDGPFQHSQFWYRIVADGPQRSHLEFRGLRLESSSRPLSARETAQRAKRRRSVDSEEWRKRLAPALERDLAGSRLPPPVQRPRPRRRPT